MDKDIPLLLSQLPDNAEMTKQIFAAKLLRDTDLCAKHGSLYGQTSCRKNGHGSGDDDHYSTVGELGSILGMIECQSTNYLMILLLMVVSGARTPLLGADEDEDEGVD